MADVLAGQGGQNPADPEAGLRAGEPLDLRRTVRQIRCGSPVIDGPYPLQDDLPRPGDQDVM
ncbi:hypothetical protein GCM10017559_50800 [Streptosporangium longisporum]|uniref:Uncharacterized protein n=1 Tax=Streptosporangium longisporum TaxID=46187 RepID=A0ABP6KTB1_9ACTN